MRRNMLGIRLCSMIILFFTNTVHAQAEIYPGPSLRANPYGGPYSQRGTRFLVELNGGFLLKENIGPQISGVFGVGGRLRDTLPIFYVVSEYSYSKTREDVGFSSAVAGFKEEYQHSDLSAGLRVYLPIFSMVRIFAEVQGGGAYSTVELIRNNAAGSYATGWQPLFSLGGGVQLRVHRNLSLGLRAKHNFTDDNLLGTSGNRSGRTILSAGITCHF